MKGKLLAFVVVAAAGLAGCAAAPQGDVYQSGSARDPAPQEYRYGMFGDLTWNVNGRKDAPAAAATPAPATPATASASEQAEFRKWRESAGSAERQEFEEWRAWQEWKRKNPK